MSDPEVTKFAQALAVLESLEAAYTSAADDSEKNRIKETIGRVIGEIPDDHLVAFQLYADERVRLAESKRADVRNISDQLEAERERRRGSIQG